jgi:hyperosmotically inducible periplasmic protein
MKIQGVAAVLLAFALVLTAGAARVAAQEKKESAQDAAYAKELEIRDLLLEKGGQSALGIRVTVDGTKAILTGEVPGRPAQELAEEVVRSVDGIKSVDNRLRIKPPSGAAPEPHSMTQELADAQLEARVKRQIHGEIGKWSKQIGVEAVDGVVSLRGTLPDASRKQLALDTAGKTKGVRKVIDLIKIKA